MTYLGDNLACVAEVISELYMRIGEAGDGVWTVFLID
jgi:hypothetical protein